jgi:hypothetical protein
MIKAREQFPDLLREHGLTGAGVEIGVKEGKFSRVLLKSDLSTIYLIDPWLHYECGNATTSQEEHDRRYESVLKEFSSTRVLVLRTTSVGGIRRFKDGSLDFVYIDADHRYQFIKEDLAVWYPKVKSGGIFAGHDYLNIESPHTVEVKQAVDEFVEEKGLDLNITEEPRWKSWWIVVR